MNDSYFSTPEFISISLHIISILALPLQIFGAYCIVWRSPSTMKSVKWSMLNLHFWSVMLDWSITILIVPVVLFPAAAGFGLGLLDKLGISLQYQCTLFTAIIWSVLVATVTVFESRYNLMYGRETLWAKFRYPLLAANWISAFFYPLPAFLAFPEQAEALKVVMEVSLETKTHK
ncbi:Protein CBG01169 [Caenorhabditis briggsae]|uniref:Protein CBG01169 n=1 Tax=Caenorhabditis briggsae TaxID=6238 RepID=A8WPR1_CAEBR|nr:Protein CBG01169 [Caenorhabditis briggsae]CAP22468.1 Protein CBG01169 [Caenorhabditis briggsae]